MTQTNYDCFSAVVAALDNLDEQLEVMEVRGAAPKDFGLMIQESPDTLETNLLISARNKTKSSVPIDRRLNYEGIDIDTSKLFMIGDGPADTLSARFLNCPIAIICNQESYIGPKPDYTLQNIQEILPLLQTMLY